MRKIAICLCLLFLSCPALIHAEEILSVEQAVAMAMQRHPLLKAADENITVKKLDRWLPLSNMLPTVKLSYGYLRYDDAQTYDLTDNVYLPVLNSQDDPTFGDTGNVALDWDTRRPLYAYFPKTKLEYISQDNYLFSVEARQVLWSGGFFYNSYKAADNEYKVSRIDRDKAARSLKLSVIDAYYNLIKSRQWVEVFKAAVDAAKGQVTQAQAFYKVGSIAKNDLLTAQVKLAEQQQNLISADNAAKMAEAYLNTILNQDISQAVQVEKEIPAPDMQDSFEACVDTALKSRQELKSLKLRMDSAQKIVNARKGAFSPIVAATAKYQRDGEDPDVPDASWQAGIGLEWTIFGPSIDQSGTAYSGLSRAQAQLRQSGYVYEDEKNKIVLEVKNDYLAAQAAKSKMEVGMLATEQAEENLRIYRHKYNLQASTSMDVGLAQTQLTDAKRAYIQSRAEYATAVAKLKASMGIL